MNLQVNCVENSIDPNQQLFYEVQCNPFNWAPKGKTSGIGLWDCVLEFLQIN